MGHDIFAFITQSPSKNYTTGCASLGGRTLEYCNPFHGCSAPESGQNFPLSSEGQPFYDLIPKNPATIIQQPSPMCSGIFSCETIFAYDLISFNIQLNIMKAHSLRSRAHSICGYAFIAQINFPVHYNISSFSGDISPHSKVVPAVLEWAVGNNISCHEAERGHDYACGNNSFCINSTQGLGYKCRCHRSYTGNPYLPNGCKGVGIAIGVLILLVIALWLYKRLEKRKKDILKRKFFDENGGRLLRHMMVLSKGSVDKMKLYIIEELEKATDNFNVNRILGKGGFGTVYKGMLQDGSIVAVKKSDKVDEMQVEQFVNEVFIFTQIYHKHIVKLLGCCLETEVPLLVYEHVSNGTLSHHLHEKDHLSTLSWENRLRIASEIADALDYLHSYGSATIFHKDLKSANILVDENLRTIVADFGISRSVSMKKTHLTESMVQGTHGYLDPEYFQTCQFTSKSDVYAFGVLLAEVITGEKAICMDRNKQGLASHFTSVMKNNDLFEIMDHTVVLNENQKEEILVVARIVERCVEPTGDKRPTMKDVARELQKLRNIVLEQQLVE